MLAGFLVPAAPIHTAAEVNSALVMLANDNSLRILVVMILTDAALTHLALTSL